MAPGDIFKSNGLVVAAQITYLCSDFSLPLSVVSEPLMQVDKRFFIKLFSTAINKCMCMSTMQILTVVHFSLYFNILLASISW